MSLIINNTTANKFYTNKEEEEGLGTVVIPSLKVSTSQIVQKYFHTYPCDKLALCSPALLAPAWPKVSELPTGTKLRERMDALVTSWGAKVLEKAVALPPAETLHTLFKTWKSYGDEDRLKLLETWGYQPNPQYWLKQLVHAHEQVPLEVVYWALTNVRPADYKASEVFAKVLRQNWGAQAKKNPLLQKIIKMLVPDNGQIPATTLATYALNAMARGDGSASEAKASLEAYVKAHGLLEYTNGNNDNMLHLFANAIQNCHQSTLIQCQEGLSRALLLLSRMDPTGEKLLGKGNNDNQTPHQLILQGLMQLMTGQRYGGSILRLALPWQKPYNELPADASSMKGRLEQALK